MEEKNTLEEIDEVTLTEEAAVTESEPAEDVIVSEDETSDEEVYEGEVAESDEYYEMSGLTEAQKRRREIFDKITTGLLVFLLASPILILLYIFLWFILR